MNHLFRALPSMDASLDALLAADKTLHDLPRPLLREAVTDFWNSRRDDIRAGRVQDAAELALEACLPELLAFVRCTTAPRLRNVINGTGVVIHTNMGRSVLARSAQEAVRRVISGYCNLELDLHSGGRGSRYAIIDGLLQRLTGAEAGMVVNNNAAAVLLVLDTFCKGGEVIVSRGELVEIGGSFRIPEVMEKAVPACARWAPPTAATCATTPPPSMRLPAPSCACTPPTTASWASIPPCPCPSWRPWPGNTACRSSRTWAAVPSWIFPPWACPTSPRCPKWWPGAPTW